MIRLYSFSNIISHPLGLLKRLLFPLITRCGSYETDCARTTGLRRRNATRRNKRAKVEKFFDDRQRYKKLMQQAQKAHEQDKDDKHLNNIAKFNNFQMARKISGQPEAACSEQP